MACALAAVGTGCDLGTGRIPFPPFSFSEATITSVHGGFSSGDLTCEELIESYLERIEAYDDQGPELRAILTTNPRALDIAREADADFVRGATRGPLHCIPVIVKDNYDTHDMPTTGGAVTLAHSIPPDDAFVVQRLRAAGAIVLAKSNLTELAQGGTTVSSLGGQTRNPYDTTRTAGGSSGGTAAAIAADFGVLGTGSDTGQSIRSPASATSLVGVRPTLGLVSRDGVIPLSWTQDAVGPITRTVEDAARMLDVIAGHDPADPVTRGSAGNMPATYLTSLRADALTGARIGLLNDMMGNGPEHAEVNRVVREAVAEMVDLGATVVRVSIPELEDLAARVNVMDFEFEPAFEAYLASLGEGAPVKTLEEFVARGEFHGDILAGLAAGLASDGPESPEYARRIAAREDLRQLLMKAIGDYRFDALLYPHQRQLVAQIGQPQLERNGVLSHGTGFPAVTFPGGFSTPTEAAPLGVPVGIELLGPDWSEPTLLALAYAFERAVRVRQAPEGTPPLR